MNLTFKIFAAGLLCFFQSMAFAFDVIAHRGASGYLPEHTAEATVLAYMQGADYIEQDLVATKDGHLVVLHDIHLETVTNVEQVFPNRSREDGRYYAIDFTLAELRLLSIHERTAIDGKQVYPTRYKGKAFYSVKTFAEMVELIRSLNSTFSKTTGLYPEIKAAAWHKQQGVDIVAIFAKAYKDLSLNDDIIIVQSFEPETLIRLRRALGKDATLVQLIAENSWQETSTDYDKMKTPQGIKEVATYANGIGPWIPQLFETLPTTPSALSVLAKEQGLIIHPYTLRSDQLFDDIPTQVLLKALRELGIDGIFTDQVDAAVMASPSE